MAAESIPSVALIDSHSPAHRREELQADVAKAVDWSAPLAKLVAENKFGARSLEWLVGSTHGVVGDAVKAAIDRSTEITLPVSRPENWDQHFEKLLTNSNARHRKRLGAFMTPAPLADFIVRALHRLFRNRVGIPDPFQNLPTLDPALGAGAFPSAILRLALHTNPDGDRERVLDKTLGRLEAYDVFLPALVFAHFRLALELCELGYRFSSRAPLRWQWRNALTAPTHGERFQIVLGNPPFGSLSTSDDPWILERLRDQNGGYTGRSAARNGARKHWLHDDYVKFFRLAQWHVSQSDVGAIAYVTNRSYLDNASFAEMRSSLLNDFPLIEIYDFGGYAREQTIGGHRDESLFAIPAGAAVALCVRANSLTRHVSLAKIHGLRQEKFEWLQRAASTERESGNDLGAEKLEPCSPHFFLRAQTQKRLAEYDSAISLRDIFCLFGSAPVTARDSLVVSKTRVDLLAKLARFRDDRISDEAIRVEFFSKSRSPRHLPGDTRSWKLSEARARLRTADDLESSIHLCEYRPWDTRLILWRRDMIDWPRIAVAEPILKLDNLCLVTRKHSPHSGLANFFWVTKRLPLDGVIRSDNRGNESLFPLWRFGECGAEVNFTKEWMDRISSRYRLPFDARCSGQSFADETRISPWGAFAYLYGLFSSKAYRSRYAHALAEDFPRAPLPCDYATFRQMARVGAQLIALHANPLLFSDEEHERDPALDRIMVVRKGESVVVQSDRRTITFDAIEDDVWNYRFGSYQTARKWLLDRGGTSEARLREGYEQVLARIRETISLQSALDVLVSQESLERDFG